MVQTIDPRRNIIALLGLQELSEAKQLAILEKAVDLVEARMNARIIQKLDAAGIEEFEKLKADSAAVSAFFSQHVPDYAAIMEEEIEAVRTKIKDLVATLD